MNDQTPLASLVMSKPAEPLTGVSPSLGMSVNTRTFLALGAGSRKVMVLSAFTSGERALVTTLASTPGPRPRPVGPLPPGGLLLIWAWTEVATSVASAVAGRTRRIRFIMSASLISAARSSRNT